MSGLIWNALGQSVANIGNTVGGYMLKDIEDERRLAEEARREEAAIRRLEESDRIKAERERAREEELQQRIIRDSAAARERGARIGAEREAGAFNKLAESSQRAADAGDVGSLRKEQLAEIARTNPELAREYQRMGLIDAQLPTTPDEKRLRRAEDDVRGAMDVGAHSTVVKAYQDIKKTVLDEIKEKNDKEAGERKDALTESRNEQRHRETMEGLRVREKAVDNKAAATTGAASTKLRSTYTDDQGNKVGVMSDGSTKVLGRAADFDRNLANLITKMAKDDYKFAKMPEEEKRRVALERLSGGGAFSSSSDNNGIVKSDALPAPQSKAEFEKLAPGTRYRAPDGTTRIK